MIQANARALLLPYLLRARAQQVTLGGRRCLSATRLNATAIVCVADGPERPGLFPLTVFQSGRGFAALAAALQQLPANATGGGDRWSSPCTWPGRALPQAGADVTIPPGRTVLLDVSPPPLGRLTVEGTLVFDHTRPYLNLQARTIFVTSGGNMTVSGPGGTPYPGNARANITLLGAVTGTAMAEQPVFDKALAVRHGTVALNGAARLPPFTQLNVTADVNATAIVANGMLLGWQVMRTGPGVGFPT
jgi:hypothetical protein